MCQEEEEAVTDLYQQEVLQGSEIRGCSADKACREGKGTDGWSVLGLLSIFKLMLILKNNNNKAWPADTSRPSLAKYVHLKR